MKRLLTCLFLIIGLGLVFSVNANAKTKGLHLLKKIVQWDVVVKHASKDYYKQKKYIGGSDSVIYDLDKDIYILNPKNAKDEAILIAKKKCWKDHPNSKSGCLIDEISRLEPHGPGGGSNSVGSWNAPSIHTYYWEKELAKYNAKKEKKVAKKEPTQTQQVAKSGNDEIEGKGLTVYIYNSSSNTSQTSFSLDFLSFKKCTVGYPSYLVGSKCSWDQKGNILNFVINTNDSRYVREYSWKYLYPINISLYAGEYSINLNQENSTSLVVKKYGITTKIIASVKDGLTLIAQKEPTQTQQVAKTETKTEKRLIRIYFCAYKNRPVKLLTISTCPVSYRIVKIKDINQIEYQINRFQNICFDTKVYLLTWNRDKCKTDLGEFKVKLDSTTSKFYYNHQENLITKKEPKKEEKKRLQEAKKAEKKKLKEEKKRLQEEKKAAVKAAKDKAKDTGTSITKQIKELNKLYKKGFLTEEEFKEAKKQIINN